MSHRVKVTFDDDAYGYVCDEAAAKFLTVSEYIRMAVASHIGKYASGGLLAEARKRRRTTFDASDNRRDTSEGKIA